MHAKMNLIHSSTSNGQVKRLCQWVVLPGCFYFCFRTLGYYQVLLSDRSGFELQVVVCLFRFTSVNWKSELQKGRDRKRSLIFTCPMATMAKALTELSYEPETSSRSPIWVAGSNTWTVFCCLLTYSSRDLDQKSMWIRGAGSFDLSWNSYGMPALHLLPNPLFWFPS